MSAFNYTDLGNARRLVAWYGKEFKYVPQWGTWLYWDSTRWARDTTGAVVRAAKDSIGRMYREAGELEPKERQRYVSHALASESRSRIEAMIKLASTESGMTVTPDKLDTNSWLLNTLNGTIDLQTGVLRPHDPIDLITKRIDVAYNPKAYSLDWLRFTDQALEFDSELMDYVQMAVGYTLTGDCSEHCLFFLTGAGANGKSTFIEVLLSLLGEYQIRTPTEALMTKDRSGAVSNDIARFAGVRLAAANETEENQRLAESTVKSLTSNDTISARFLYGEFFDFQPTHKLWMAGNHKPMIRGGDEGIWRRIRIIPFNAKIPKEKRDPHLLQKLRKQLPGILNWALEGCMKWQEKGLPAMPKAILDATQEYRAEMDVIGTFLADSTVPDTASTPRARTLYLAYQGWAEESGERPITQRAFGLRLKERGFAQGRNSVGDRTWLGLKLKESVNS